MTDPRQTLFSKLVDVVKAGEPSEPPRVSEIGTGLYSCQERYRREYDVLFKSLPLLVGHQSMIANPGEHFTHDYVGTPILVVRAEDGEIHAFLNVCRHRGVRLASAGEVRRKRNFVCPYHHWTYGLDGTLKVVPLEETLPDLDKSCRGLLRLPAETRHGFIWVNPDPDGSMDLEGFLGDIGLDFDGFDTESQVFFAQSVRTRKTNWKLIVDAFQDGYHIKRLHAKTVGPYFLDCVAEQERSKQHIRSIVARNEFAEALEMPREQWDMREHVTFAYQIFPNTTLVFHPDYLSVLSLYPTAIDESVVVHTCLIPEAPKSDEERGHWERAFDIIENGVFNAEDFFVCEQAQIGISAGATRSFLLGPHEEGLRLFHSIVQERMDEVYG